MGPALSRTSPTTCSTPHRSPTSRPSTSSDTLTGQPSSAGPPAPTPTASRWRPGGLGAPVLWGPLASRSMQLRRDAIARLGVYALLCLAPAVLYLSGHIHPFHVGNADMLAVPAFVETVKAQGLSTLGDWYWPPAPYFVPDLTLYIPLWLGLPDPWLAPAAFMVIQLGALAGAGRFLARNLSDGQEAGYWGALGSFAVFVILSERAVEPARYVLASYYRAGTFILGLVGLTLLLRMIRAGAPYRDRLRLSAVALGSAVLVCSDPLAAPSAVMPLAVLVLALTTVPSERGGWSDRRWDGFMLATSLAVGTGIGLVANARVASDEASYGPSLSGETPRRQLGLLVDLVIELDLEAQLVGIISVAILVGVAVQSWTRHEVVRGPTVVLAFWVISAAAHTGAILIDTTAPAVRYLQLLFGVPILAAGPLLSGLRWAGPAYAPIRLMATGGLAAVVVAATVPAVMRLDDVKFEQGALEAECLDQVLATPERLTGFSGYWEARTVQLHSRYDRELATLDGLGNPYRINAAPSWFETPWSFAIIGSSGTGFDPPIEWARKLAPDATESSCGPYTVLVFDQPLDPNPLDEPGEQVRWSGCELRTISGHINNQTCIVEVPPTDEPSFGSYGGYTPLPPGRFNVAFRYRSTAPAGVDIADLELTRLYQIDGEIDVVTSRPLSGTGGQWTTINETLEVFDDGRNHVAEVRTLTHGTYPYEVESFELTALEPHGSSDSNG